MKTSNSSLHACDLMLQEKKNKTKTKQEGGLEQGIVLKAKEFDYLRKSDIACSRLSVVGDERKKEGDKNGKFNKALPNDNVLKSVYTHMS